MAAEKRAPETILLVDDEQALLSLVEDILKDEGYTVLPALSGAEGLEAGRRHPGKIDLLLTDIVMPGMSGGKLFKQLQLMQPGIRVLYMSGYTKYTVVGHGALESVDSFIWKPFSPAQLLQKVREVLDAPDDTGRTGPET